MNRATFATRALGALSAATASSKLAAIAAADTYPSRPITLVVPWGAGGGADQMGRTVAKILEDTLKTATVPVINAPGANGNDGMLKLIAGDADGYTLAVLVGDTFVGNMLSKISPPWQMKDVVPLAIMNRQPFAYYVAANSSYKTWADVEKAAKSAPLRVALSGFGGAEDVVTKYFASKGLKLVGVPFPKPGERYAAVLGGQVDLMCDPDGNVRRYVEAHQLRGIVVFSKRAVPELTGTKTATELGYPIVLSEWRGIVAKTGTDPAKVQFLSDALARAYKTAEFQDFLKTSWSAVDSYVPAKQVPGFLSAQEQEIKTLVAAIR